MKLDKLLFLLISLVFFIHCGSRNTMVRKHYLLETKALLDQQLIGVAHPFAYNAEIRDFLIEKPYQDLRIPMRSQTNELVYYFYHYWAEKPSEAVTDFVYHLFLQANIFQRCSRTSSGFADIIISGEIRTMERQRIKKNDFVHLSGKMVLTEGKTAKAIIEYEFDRLVELKKNKSMNGFAELVSKTLFDETEEFILRVADYYLYPQG